MFWSKKNKPDFTVNFMKVDEEVEYGKVTGFFEFRGEVFYRAKGVAARHLHDMEKSFTDKIKEMYPEEFAEVTAAQISTVKVRPLVITE